jgi:hypothetical protein
MFKNGLLWAPIKNIYPSAYYAFEHLALELSDIDENTFRRGFVCLDISKHIQDVRGYIERKAAASTIKDPFICLELKDGYFFFGRIDAMFSDSDYDPVPDLIIGPAFQREEPPVESEDNIPYIPRPVPIAVKEFIENQLRKPSKRNNKTHDDSEHEDSEYEDPDDEDPEEYQ